MSKEYNHVDAQSEDEEDTDWKRAWLKRWTKAYRERQKNAK